MYIESANALSDIRTLGILISIVVISVGLASLVQ